MMNQARAYIGLGSNLNGPRQQILLGLSALDELPGCRVRTCSSIYRSEPMGPPNQPDYVNAVAAVDTQLEPLELLEQLQAVERQQGRVDGGEHWGPRILDLDLLLYDNLQIDTEVLVVPHPGLHQRAFVLYPLAEIAPGLTIPGLGSLPDLMKNCPVGNMQKLEAAE